MGGGYASLSYPIEVCRSVRLSLCVLNLSSLLLDLPLDLQLPLKYV